VKNHLAAVMKDWLCRECGFRSQAAAKEEGQRHCPRCYKKEGNVEELIKIPMNK